MAEMPMQFGMLIPNFLWQPDRRTYESDVSIPRPNTPKISLSFIFLLLEAFEFLPNCNLSQILRISKNMLRGGFRLYHA